MNPFGHAIRSWVLLLVTLVVAAAPAANAGSLTFAPQTRVGFTSGDQWEPAIAADRFGHVYVLYPQYEGVPGCPTCFSPTMILQLSADHGATWGTPTIIYPAGSTLGQYDAQITVDPVDGMTVYAAWLQDGGGGSELRLARIRLVFARTVARAPGRPTRGSRRAAANHIRRFGGGRKVECGSKR